MQYMPNSTGDLQADQQLWMEGQQGVQSESDLFK
jgi:hypothetical protein